MFVGGFLAKQNGDVLREDVRMLAQAVMGTEVTGAVAAILREQGGQWAVDERRHFSAVTRKRLLTPALRAVKQELLMAFA